MKATMKVRWIEALRSGKYKQGMAKLKNLNAKLNPVHCCLGVLAETIAAEYPNDIHVEQHRIIIYGHDHEALTQEFTHDFCNKIGMEMNDMEELMRMNDSGISFEEIANYIDEKVC